MPTPTKTADTTPYEQPIPHTPFRYIWYIVKPYKWLALATVVIVVIGSAASQGTNYFLKLIVDAVESGNTEMVVYYALAYPVTVFVVQVLFRLGSIVTRSWVVNGRKRGYDQLTDYTLRHSDRYFADRFAGSLMSKVANVVDAVDDVSVTMIWTHLTAFVSFLVTFGFIVTVDVWAGIVFVALIIFLIVLNRRFGPTKTTLAKENSEAKTAVRGKIVDTFSNIQAVRQYARFAEERVRVGEVTTRMTQANYRNWGYTEYMMFWNTFVLFCFSVVLFWLLVQTWQAGGMGTGDFVLIISLYAQITGTLVFIGRAFESTARSVGEIQEGLEDILLPHEVIDTPNAKQLSVNGGGIVWQQVDFTYEENRVFDKALDHEK